jgi:hypothetical protein
MLKKQEQSQIQTNVSATNDEMPTDEALKISAKVNLLNQDLILTMKEFNGLLSSKTLPENKSVKEKEKENLLIKDLINIAKEINQYTSGEGTLALVIFLIRQNLLLRDAGNRLAYEIKQLKNPKEEQIEDANKKFLLEKAKEFGFKVSIEDE